MAHQPLDLSRDVRRLLLLVVRLEDGDRPAPRVFRPQLLWLALRVGADDPLGHLEDGPRGSVVLLQQHDLQIWVVLLEVQDVPNVG